MPTQFFGVSRTLFPATLLIWLSLAASTLFGNDQVPYKGTAVGVITEQLPTGTGDPMSPFGEPFLLVRARGIANFTHVGKAAITISYTARLALIDGEIYILGLGTYTVTAANGWTITGPFKNRQLFGSEDFTADVAVEAGTGGFKNATGDLTAVGKAFADGSFFYDLDGTITSVGGAKR